MTRTKLIALALALALLATAGTAFADERGRNGRAFDDELQGQLTAVNLSALTITVGNRTAALSPDVVIEVDQAGSRDEIAPVANLGNYLGAFVEVEFDDAGLVVKLEVKAEAAPAGRAGFDDEELGEFEGTLAAVDLEAMTLTVAGRTLPLRVDAFVKVDQPGPDRFEQLAALANYLGETVEVKLDGRGAVVRVEIDGADEDDDSRGACTFAEGTLEAVDLGAMTVTVSGAVYPLTPNTYVRLDGAGPDRYEALSTLGSYVGRTVELRLDADGQVCRIEIQ